MRTIRKIGIILGVGVLVIVFGILCLRASNEMGASNVVQKTIKELFDTEGHFFVYFSREDCRYCENIKEDMNVFSEQSEVYIIDPELCEGIKNYDWNEHELEYDIEIGEMSGDGTILFYDNLTEKDIKEKYPPVYYKIVLATERYSEFHEGKEVGKVYAIYTHPVLEEKDLNVEDFCVPAIPILVEFDENKVVNYYFDDKEIIEFLESDTKPLDNYWNLE